MADGSGRLLPVFMATSSPKQKKDGIIKDFIEIIYVTRIRTVNEAVADKEPG